jgi:hypothetical protein
MLASSRPKACDRGGASEPKRVWCWKEWVRTTLGSNNTTILQGSMEKLKVWLLEQRLCWTLWITAVGDDDIEFVFAVSQEFEAISNVHFDSRVLEADGHARQVFLADTRDSFVNVTEDGLLH